MIFGSHGHIFTQIYVKINRMKKPYLSIFFPYLNDWGTIGSLLLLATDTAKKITPNYELLVIDDGSNPMAKAALDSFKKNVPKLRVIHNLKNTGYGSALRLGFTSSKGELIFYTDGDAQYDVRELQLLYAAYRPGIGLVNGYKIHRHDPWYRIILGEIYHQLVKLAFRLPLKDTDCDFRLIENQVFNQVKLYENSGTICVELVKKISHFGYKIKQVPVNHYDRPSGFSQFFNFRRLYNTIVRLMHLWWKLIIQGDYYT